MTDQPDSSQELFLSNDPFKDDDPYEVLGLDRDADRPKVKSAYRALQRRAKRGDELWIKAQVANEVLTKPRKRLLVDLFVVYQKGLHQEIVRRYREVTFELIPTDPTPLLLQVSDPEWPDPGRDFAVPPVPKVVFQSMIPAAPRRDEDIIPMTRIK